MPSNRPNCTNPTLIFNSHVKPLMLDNPILYVPAFEYHIDDGKLVSEFLGYSVPLRFSHSDLYFQDYLRACYAWHDAIKDDHDLIDFLYVVDPKGVVVPCFKLVACGHCELCRNAKALEWSNRAQIECECHDELPIFLTLTYAPDHLPKDGVCKEHVQKFLKRLRINMTRSGYDVSNLRYVFFSEYGGHYGRPHYHALLYGMPKCLYEDYRNVDGSAIFKYDDSFNLCRCSNDRYNSIVEQFLRDAWSPNDDNIGFITALQCYNTSCGKYTTKYMLKAENAPEGKNANFRLASRGKGAIGFPAFSQLIQPYLKENPDSATFEYMSKFSGKVEKFNVPYYFLLKTFPSKSYMFPVEYRRQLYTYHESLNLLRLFSRWQIVRQLEIDLHFRITDPILNVPSYLLKAFDIPNLDVQTLYLMKEDSKWNDAKVKDLIDTFVQSSSCLDYLSTRFAHHLIKECERNDNMRNIYYSTRPICNESLSVKIDRLHHMQENIVERDMQ